MEGKAFGGRGRGRRRSLDLASAEDPAKEEKMKGGDADAVCVFQAEISVTNAGESDRGRSRGRGAGRGWGDATRGPEVQRAPLEQDAMRQLLPEPDFSDRYRYADDTPGESSVRASPQRMVQEETYQACAFGRFQQSSAISGHSSTIGTEAMEKPVIGQIGSKCKLIEMKANYLRLKLKPDHPGVVEYQVSIDPPVDDVRMRRRLLRTSKANEVLGKVQSFDGRVVIMFMPYKLPNNQTVFRTHLRENEHDVYEVSVTYKKVRPMRDCTVFYNILLHRILRHLNYREHRMEILPSESITAGSLGLMICVGADSSNKRVFRQDTVLDHLYKFKGDPQIRTKFEKFIVNKVVITKYNYKCYKIDEVAWDMRPSTMFLHMGQVLTSCKEYLKRCHNVNITKNCQPLLISKLKPRKNEATTEGEGARFLALVPECCYCNVNVSGRTVHQKSNFMTNLPESTRLVPAQHVADLERFINRIAGDEKVKAILGDWGVYIEKNVSEVPGRNVDGRPQVGIQRVCSGLLKNLQS